MDLRIHDATGRLLGTLAGCPDGTRSLVIRGWVMDKLVPAIDPTEAREGIAALVGVQLLPMRNGEPGDFAPGG